MTGMLWRTITVFTLLVTAGFSWGDEANTAPKPARKISHQKVFQIRPGDRDSRQYRVAGYETENLDAENASERHRSFYCPPGSETRECEENRRSGISCEVCPGQVQGHCFGSSSPCVLPPAVSPDFPVDEAPCCATGNHSHAGKCGVCPAPTASSCPKTCCQTEKVAPKACGTCVKVAVCAAACGCGDKCCCKEKCGCGEKCQCGKTSASVNCPHPARHTARLVIGFSACGPLFQVECCGPVITSCGPLFSVCPVTNFDPSMFSCCPVTGVSRPAVSCCPVTGSCRPTVSAWCPVAGACGPLPTFCYPLTKVSGTVISVCPVQRDPRARAADYEDRISCDEVQEVVEIRFSDNGEINRRRYEVRRYLHGDGRNASRTTGMEDHFDWIIRRVPYNQSSELPQDCCPWEWQDQP